MTPSQHLHVSEASGMRGVPSFTVTVHHGPYLLIVATGTAQYCDLIGAVNMAAAITQFQPYSRILFDLVSVQISLSQEEHVSLGRHVARSLVALERVASVVDERFRVGTSEQAARRIGLQLRTFTDLKLATDWLSASASDRSPQRARSR